MTPCGFDAAEFADGAEWAFGFDDEADELDDAAAVFEDACVACALEGLGEALAGAGWGKGLHELKIKN